MGWGTRSATSMWEAQEYALSYTGNFATNSTIGGDDIVLTAIPEPGTWGMILVDLEC